MKPITGALRQQEHPIFAEPCLDPDLLKERLLGAMSRFLEVAEAWREISGQIPSSWSADQMRDSTLSVKRSPKTGKIVISESRNQARSAHAKLQAGRSVKPRVITHFLDLEAAILSIPAFAHPGWRLGYKSPSSRHFHLDLQGYTLYSSHRSAKESEGAAQKLLFLVEALATVSSRPDAPFWIAGTRLVPAPSAADALHIHTALRAVGHIGEARAKALTRPDKVFVGQVADMDSLRAEVAARLAPSNARDT